MDDLLQKRDPGSSRYERPFRKWQCTGGLDGQPCMRGPDDKGCCGAASACEPVKKEGRWYCTRPDSAGGACQDGPLPNGQCACRETPCEPELSVREVKRRAVWWALLLILGITTLGVGGVWTYQFINPGTIADHHVTIEQCDVCHSQTMNNGFAHWAATLFNPADVGMENQGCLQCHDLGRYPQSAHGYSLESLADKTEHRMTVMTSSLRMPLFQDEEIPCATCHKEHQEGQKISVGSCNACHLDQGNIFPETHPEFDSFPYQQRTAFIFDHSSHFNLHFPKASEQAPEQCLDCHSADTEGRRMEVKPFSQTCQSCHSQQITGADRAIGPKGVPFFVLPGIDTVTLAEKGGDVGAWPEFAEDRITPLMQELLLGESFSALMESDLLDLQDANPQTLELTFKLAWSVKTFLYDLIQLGPDQALKARMEQQLQRPVAQTEVSALAASLPLDVLTNAVHEWFPELHREVTLYRSGDVKFTYRDSERERIVGANGLVQPAEKLTASDELLAEEDKSILGGDDELLVEEDESILGGDDELLVEEDESILGGDDELLADEDESILGGDDELLVEEDKSILGGDDELLVEEDKSILGGDDELLVEEDKSILGGDDELLVEEDESIAAIAGERIDSRSGLSENTPESISPSKDASTPVTALPQVSAEQWNQYGGWYRSEFAILYRPTGHADQVMTSLITLTGQLSERTFQQLTDAKAQGQCAKCHGRIETKDGGLNLAWQQMVETMPPQQLTLFRHTPHFATQTVEGCGTCHILGEHSKDYQQAFEQTQNSVFTSNFEPMVKAQCESCHSKQTGLNQCVSCHQYHPGGAGVKPLRTLLSTATQ